MRIVSFLCVSTLVWSTGCAAACRTSHSSAEQQWEALCRRMPKRRPPSATGEAHRSSLTREQKEALDEIAMRALDAVVRVKTVGSDRKKAWTDAANAKTASARSGGTGVVISSDGLILTNEHVVRHALHVSVVFKDGTEYPVKVIIVHPHQDVAVLQIAREQMPCASLSFQPVKPGMLVVAVAGNNTHRDCIYRRGVVTSRRTSLQRELDPTGQRDYSKLLETTVKLEPGFSGGPLLDAEGHLVGLNVAATGSEGADEQRGYAIPFDHHMNEAIGQLMASARTH